VAVLGLALYYVPLLAHGVVVHYLLVTGHQRIVLKALGNGKNCPAQTLLYIFVQRLDLRLFVCLFGLWDGFSPMPSKYP
jgi:hypothetical protein